MKTKIKLKKKCIKVEFRYQATTEIDKFYQTDCNWKAQTKFIEPIKLNNENVALQNLFLAK